MLKAIAYCWACLALPQLVYGATTSPEISIKGSRLYKPNGDQFFVKGVSYYLDEDNYTRDRLVDTKQCEIDAELMAHMGYDPVWTRAMYEDCASKIDEFAKYSNLLAFGIGGDTIDVDDCGEDMKAFRDGRGYRQIPISYNQYDSSDLKNTVVDYLTCGDYTDSIDMFGLGLYQACGSDVRNFTEVETILTGTWSEVFGGAVVWDWANKTNTTALVEYPDADHTGKPVLLPDYTRLQSIFSSARCRSTAAAEYTPTACAPACPTQDEYYHWGVDANLPLPTISGLPSVTRAGPGGIPKPTDGSAALDDETKGVIVGGSAGIAILVALGWLILRRRRTAQYAQGTGAMTVGGGTGSGSDNNNSGDYKPGQGYAPTNVYLGPQEMSGSGEHPAARHELYSGEYSAMQPAGAVAYAAGSLKPRGTSTVSGPQTPSELSPGAGHGRRGSYQMQSVSDYDGTTPWSSPRMPAQTFEMEGDSGVVTHTPPAADSAGNQAPKQQLETPIADTSAATGTAVTTLVGLVISRDL
ncbi:glycoside hydrolase family 72 protein [Apiospora aurea]|uniref:1,3-beta-glucanosyltransferase n=1 Tax=Apiospora aurea TaxID=335848 RepID=A0ABR1Q452_9PEZI